MILFFFSFFVGLDDVDDVWEVENVTILAVMMCLCRSSFFFFLFFILFGSFLDQIGLPKTGILIGLGRSVGCLPCVRKLAGIELKKIYYVQTPRFPNLKYGCGNIVCVYAM